MKKTCVSVNTTNNLQRYKKFLEDNGKITWTDRFTYKGLNGNEVYPKYSIIKFMNQLSDEDKEFISKIKSARSLYNQVNNLSVSYVNWCKSISNSLSSEELVNLSNFFKGAIGEYFFNTFFNLKTQFYVEKYNTLFTFYNIAPRLINEYDSGIDFTGSVNISNEPKKSRDCGIQIKFWCPDNDYEFIDKHIADAAYADAISSNIANLSEEKNVFIFWLGNEKHISSYLNKLSYNKNLVIVGMKDLQFAIKDDNEFWNKIVESILNIKNI